jgi:hypothetical protein
MSKKLQQLREERPELLTDPDVILLAEQADMAHDIKALYDTAGGKQLVELLIQNVVGSVHRLRGGFATMPHMELVAIIAQIDSDLATAKLLIDSKDVNEVLDAELEEALRE